VTSSEQSLLARDVPVPLEQARVVNHGRTSGRYMECVCEISEKTSLEDPQIAVSQNEPKLPYSARNFNRSPSRAQEKAGLSELSQVHHLSRGNLSRADRPAWIKHFSKSRSVRTTSGKPPLPWQPESCGPTGSDQYQFHNTKALWNRRV